MKDLSDMCRLCLEKGRSMQPIFKSESSSLVKLIDVLQLETTEGDGLPAHMCHQCAFKLDAAYVFKKRCHDNLEKLRDILQQVSETDENKEGPSYSHSSVGDESLNEDSNTSEDDDDTDDDMPLSRIPVECLYKEDVSESGKNKRKTSKSNKNHTCSVCNKSFVLAIQLKTHLRTHKENKHKCLVCYKTFSNQAKFKAHLRSHVGTPVQCTMCDKVFLNENYLEEHVKTHTLSAVSGGGEIVAKPFHCESCDKSFLKQAHLVEHMRCHSGERPFSCDVCKKKFTTKCNLTRHGRVHS